MARCAIRECRRVRERRGGKEGSEERRRREEGGREGGKEGREEKKRAQLETAASFQQRARRQPFNWGRASASGRTSSPVAGRRGGSGCRTLPQPAERPREEQNCRFTCTVWRIERKTRTGKKQGKGLRQRGSARPGGGPAGIEVGVPLREFLARGSFPEGQIWQNEKMSPVRPDPPGYRLPVGWAEPGAAPVSPRTALRGERGRRALVEYEVGCFDFFFSFPCH